jgi:hypothetical protein
MPAEPDLSQPADMYWLPANEKPSPGPEWNGERLQFATVRDAVCDD